MKKKTEIILVVLNVLAWIAFIGLLVEAGTMISTYSLSIIKPALTEKLYEGKALLQLRQLTGSHFVPLASLMVALVLIKAYIAYLVIKVLSKIQLTNPFTKEVADMLQGISYYILAWWCVVLLHNNFLRWLAKSASELYAMQVSDEFIFLAGVVFVFAQVFKKGVELQSESDLTV